MQVRHHYVPQFYLKRFSISTKPDIVCVYTRRKEPFYSHVCNVALEKHFYTVNLELTGEKSDQIEKMFSKIEGDTAPLFMRLASDIDIEFSDDELTLLSLFIAHLYNRGPAFRRKQYDAEVIRRKKLIEFVAQDRERFAKMTKEAGLTFRDKNDAESMRQSWLDFDNNIFSNFFSYNYPLCIDL